MKLRKFWTVGGRGAPGAPPQNPPLHSLIHGAVADPGFPSCAASTTDGCSDLLLPPANEVCEGCVFTPVSHSVHRMEMVSQHALQVSRPTSRGGIEGSGWGVSRPTPRGRLRGLAGGSPGPDRGDLQAHTWGEGAVSKHALRQTPCPLSRRLLLWAVHILLGCTLVLQNFC